MSRRGPPPSSKPPKRSGGRSNTTGRSSTAGKGRSNTSGTRRPAGPPPSKPPSKFGSTVSTATRRGPTGQLLSGDDSGAGKENRNATKSQGKVVMPSYLKKESAQSNSEKSPRSYSTQSSGSNSYSKETTRSNSSVLNQYSLDRSLEPVRNSKSSSGRGLPPSNKPAPRKGPPSTKPPAFTNKPGPPSNKPGPPSNKPRDLAKAHPSRPPPSSFPGAKQTTTITDRSKPPPPITSTPTMVAPILPKRKGSRGEKILSGFSAKVIKKRDPRKSTGRTPLIPIRKKSTLFKADDYVEYNTNNGWKRGYIVAVNDDGSYEIMKENQTIGHNWRENFVRPLRSVGGSNASSVPKRKISIPKKSPIPVIRGPTSSSTPAPMIPKQTYRPTVSPNVPKKNYNKTQPKKENPELDELIQWLTSLKMEKYIDQFKEENYTNLTVLLEMDQGDVREMLRDIGIKGGDKSIIRREIKNLKAGGGGPVGYTTNSRTVSNVLPRKSGAAGGGGSGGYTNNSRAVSNPLPRKSRSGSKKKNRPPPPGAMMMGTSAMNRKDPPPPKARGLPPKARGMPPSSRGPTRGPPSNPPSYKSNNFNPPASTSQFGIDTSRKPNSTPGIDLSIEDTDALVVSATTERKLESNCHCCSAKFNVMRSRYECIKCGHNVCNNCSPFKMKDTDWESGKVIMKRICSDCSNANKVAQKRYKNLGT